jgi:hypothetical protein
MNRMFLSVAATAIGLLFTVCDVSTARAADHQVCVDYAKLAVATYKETLKLGCQEKNPTPGRLSDNFDGHYRWCRGVRNSTLDNENVAREKIINNCRRCDSYAGGAVAAAKRYLGAGCGQREPRWDTHHEGHRNWCLTVRKSTQESEDAIRKEKLDTCIDRKQQAAAARARANQNASCPARQSNVECKGVVMFCDDGYYTQRTNTAEWHSCDKYVCGACFGFWSDWKEGAIETGKGLGKELSPLSRPGVRNRPNIPNLPYGPDTCKQGFVWREAIDKDHVCVTPESRQQARTDNAARASRVSRTGGASGADTCVSGYVWREAVPSDHVCVLPQVREQVRRENSQIEQNRVRGSRW